MTAIEALLAVLKEMKSQGPRNPSMGICSNAIEIACSNEKIGRRYRGAPGLLLDTMTKWPKYSGDSLYPIPGGLPSYKDAREYDLMWDKGTVYGALRWELLDWLIETLEKDIKS